MKSLTIRKIILLCFVLILLFTFFACTDKQYSVFEFESVRAYQNLGVDYNYYTLSFVYTKVMAEQYYEIFVQYDKTSYYIQQDYIYFQRAYNVNNTAIKVPGTKALFGIQLPSAVKKFTVTLCRCNTKSSNKNFAVLERLCKKTYEF